MRGARLGRTVGSLASAIVFAGACSDAPETSAPPTTLPERVRDGGAPETGLDAGDDDGSTAHVSSCTNGVQDEDETDVDCGGAVCAPCANGRACVARRDCASALCAGARCNGDLGCSDGTREGFSPPANFASIAACAGGWSLPGLLEAATTKPACDRGSGNDSANAAGMGCNVADLCQGGWHVCTSAAEVGAKSGSGCAGAAVAGQFFVTRQSGSGSAQCGAGANDLFGCGMTGAAPDPITCAPLDAFSNDLCAALPATFSCGADGLNEANNVTKTGREGGGVLCCRD